MKNIKNNGLIINDLNYYIISEFEKIVSIISYFIISITFIKNVIKLPNYYTSIFICPK